MYIIVPYANCTDGELRTDMQDDEDSTRGRLEICSNNVWFSIYYSHWWLTTVSWTRSSACSLLGYDARACKFAMMLCVYSHC